MAPHVSICIPAYGEAALLARALQSVFEQTFTEFEVIVTDDSDSTALEDALAPWRGDPRLRYVRNPARLGSPENWSRAVGLAQGRLIKVLHHDDWFAASGSLQQYVSLIEAQAHAVFAFSATQGCTAGGRPLGLHAPSAAQLEALKRDPRCLLAGNFVGAPSATIFRRKAGFRFDPALQWLVDLDSYIRLLKGGATFAYTSEPLINVTESAPHQVTHTVQGDWPLQFAEYAHVYKPLGFAGIERLRFARLFASFARRLDAGGVERVLRDARAQDLPPEAAIPLALQKLRLGAARILRRAPQLK